MKTPPATVLPDLLASLDDLERFYFRDLAGRTDEELLAEEIRTKADYGRHAGKRTRIPIPGGANTMLASAWLLERLRAIRAAGSGRSRGTR